MQRVTILSGVPGSGKSTYARDFLKPDVTVSADNFFIRDGVYRFDPTKLTEAHRECYRRFLYAIRSSDSHIVVDNTNLSAHEISPYWAVGDVYGFTVTIIRVRCDPEVAFKRQTHGVPRATFDRMVANFNKRDVLPWWNVIEF
jgi:predicted kinase